MKLTLRRLPEFNADFDALYRWYLEQGGEELADRFLMASLVTLQLLVAHPEIGQLRAFSHPADFLSHQNNFNVNITEQSPMSEVLAAYPGAQRALFRKYHIGGCSSCGFQLTETLGEVCGRNNHLPVVEVLAHIQTSHEQDAKIFISPQELIELREKDPSLKLLDVRSRQEFEATHIEGSLLMSQPTVQEIMAHWPRTEAFAIIDHQGRQALDAAAYFLGHGFEQVRCLRGGIDAWSQEADEKVPRYQLA